MKRLSPFWTVLVSLLLMSVALNIVLLVLPIPEFFGTQGGLMVQLRSSHVPTMRDISNMEQERRQIKKDLIGLTGSY